MKRFRLVIFLLVSSSATRADIDNLKLPDTKEINQTIRELRSRGSKSVGPSLNEQLDDARNAYWKQYSKGTVDEFVEARFSILLTKKDMLLMAGTFADEAARNGAKVFGGRPRNDLPPLEDLMWWVLKKAIDHGVRPLAAGEFSKWREAVGRRRDKIQPKVNFFTAVPTAFLALEASIEAGDPEWRDYFNARNRAEKLAALDRLPFDSSRDYLLTRVELESNDKQLAKQWSEQIEQIAGKQRMNRVADSLRKAGKDRDGNFDQSAFVDGDGDRLMLTTMDRADRSVGNSDARLYALWQIRRQQHVSWAESQGIYQKYWVEPFGEQKVLEAAEKVRTARKTIGRAHKEVLLNPIADTIWPEDAMIALMPQDPYRDKPLGSLDSTDPQKFLYALLKQNTPVKHWVDIDDAYKKLAAEWGRKALHEVATKVASAKKNSRGELVNPAELGVTASKPWDAFQQLLNRKLSQPDHYYAHLLKEAGWTWTKGHESTFDIVHALERYKELTRIFGQQEVDAVIVRVRSAVEKNADVSKLEGNVSGFKTPLSAIHDILVTAASPEQFVKYLSPGGGMASIWSKRYGLDLFPIASQKLQTAPKLWEPIHDFYGYREALLVDRQRLGLPPEPSRKSERDPRSLIAVMEDLLHQQKTIKDAIPFEVGEAFEFGSRRPFRVKVIRVFEADDGMNYLVDYGHVAVWVDHKWLLNGKRVGSFKVDPVKARKLEAHATESLKKNRWREGAVVRVRVDGKPAEGTLLFFEPRSSPPKWAVKYERDDGTKGVRLFAEVSDPPNLVTRRLPSGESRDGVAPDTFPIGSHVRLEFRGKLLPGKIVAYNARLGWRVAVWAHGSRASTWVHPLEVSAYKLTLVDEDSAPAAHESADQPNGDDSIKPSVRR